MHKVQAFLEANRFRKYALGWYKGYVVVPAYPVYIPGPFSQQQVYTKTLKRLPNWKGALAHVSTPSSTTH